eukprot:189761-Pleurochrysis_carterae.AAC.1
MAINQRRYNATLAQLSAAEAEQQQLLRWDAVGFNGLTFSSYFTSSSSTADTAAIAESGSRDIYCSHSHDSSHGHGGD